MMSDNDREKAERIEKLQFWLRELHHRVARLVAEDRDAAWLQHSAADLERFEQQIHALRNMATTLDAIARWPKTDVAHPTRPIVGPP
jgi:hypothetical protein